jgi:hypothetical protein
VEPLLLTNASRNQRKDGDPKEEKICIGKTLVSEPGHDGGWRYEMVKMLMSFVVVKRLMMETKTKEKMT